MGRFVRKGFCPPVRCGCRDVWAATSHPSCTAVPCCCCTGRAQRFLDKYLADPTQDVEDLRVAVTPDGRLVSTVGDFDWTRRETLAS